MNKKITCEYCNKEIYNKHKTRHQNSKECRNKQQNKEMILELKEYKCKYCNKKFNRIDKQNNHELICDAKELYYEFKYYRKAF